MKETRKMNLMVNKVGGTAGKKSVNYRVSLPSSWIREMDLGEEARGLVLEFDGKSIVIKKDCDTDE